MLLAGILKALGVSRARLLSNNPDKIAALEAGVEVVECVPCEVEPQARSEEYLETKKEKLAFVFQPLIGMNRT